MIDILFFVEDPGAANMVVGLLNNLKKYKFKYQIIAIKHATQYFRLQNVFIQKNLPKVNADEFLKNNPCLLLIVGTCENRKSFGLELIKSARTQGIFSIALVDMVCNSDRRFRGNSNEPLFYAPDRLIVTDLATREAYIKLGYPSNHIALLGHPYFDIVLQRRVQLESKKAQVGCVRNKKTPKWLFVTEGFDQLYPIASYRKSNYTLRGRGDTNWRTGIVLEEILDVVDNLSPKPILIVRPHPKLSQKDFDRWKEEIILDSITDPLESAWSADVVLGMTSMLLLEAAILGRRVLSILPSASEKKWLGPIDSGHIASVSDREMLHIALNRIHQGFDMSSPSCQWVIPNAANNIIEYIKPLIQKK